jgi:hypothetical protein
MTVPDEQAGDALTPIELALRRRRHRKLLVTLVVSAMTVAGVVLLSVPQAGAAGGCGGG